jgi:hypothetical protein
MDNYWKSGPKVEEIILKRERGVKLRLALPKVNSIPFVSPTTVESRDALGIEDYRKKSCFPIQYMETISYLFLMRRK